MRLRYQNGAVIECITLFRTETRMRVAVHDREDSMDLTNIHGTWVTDDCEPVIMETGTTFFKTVVEYSDDEFICPRPLADHLISLLIVDSMEELLDEQAPLKALRPGVTLIA